MLSEFGGYVCRIDGHIANPAKAYGYKTIADRDALTDSLEALYLGEVVPMLARGLRPTGHKAGCGAHARDRAKARGNFL